MRIHLGSGSVYLRGYVNCDVEAPGMFLARERPDLVELLATTDAEYYARHDDKTLERMRGAALRVNGVCDVFADFQRLPFEDGSATEILCRQVFEHLSIHEARRALSEAQRVLTVGGCLRIDVPDVEETARMLMETKDPFFVRHLFGSRKDDYGYHLMGYTRDGLSTLCAEYGFIRNVGEEKNIHFYPAFCLSFTNR